MGAETATRLTGGRWPASDVHAVEAYAPQRQAVEDGGRLVAHDRRTAECRQGGADEQVVARLVGQQVGTGDVRAPPESREGTVADVPGELVVGPPLGDGQPTEDEAVGFHVGTVTPSCCRRER
jgi:hypothetical protein